MAEYIEESVKNHHTVVTGDDWAAFFEEVTAASEDAEAVEALQSRVYVENRWSDPPFEVFFLPEEGLLSEVVSQLQSSYIESHYLVFDGLNGRQYLEANYYTYDSDDLGLGAVYRIHRPPRCFIRFARLGTWSGIWRGYVFCLATAASRPRRHLLRTLDGYSR